MGDIIEIPWSDLTITDEDKKAVLRVLKSNWLTLGPEVASFEKNISNYLDIQYAIGVNNGTSALDVALKCIDIKENDEVIIPALTYIATGNVILYNHGIPVFVDVDDTFNIDTSRIEQKINDRTKAIINIDFGGNPSDYDGLLRISRQYNLPLIVDGANSFGSKYHGEKCCTHGIINTTSFHAAKILTTIEGGMVLTNNKKLSEKAKTIRKQGEKKSFYHQLLGNNYRMMDLVAAIGNVRIKRFDRMLKTRVRKAGYYKENLKNVQFPEELDDIFNCNHFFLILTKKRNQLFHHLKKHGIETRITYPMPINEQPVFRKYCKDTFPKAKSLSKKVLALPIYYSLTRKQQDLIIKHFNDFQKKSIK